MRNNTKESQMQRQAHNIKRAKTRLTNVQTMTVGRCQLIKGERQLKDGKIYPHLYTWRGRQAKPFIRFYYRNEDSMNESIDRIIETELEYANNKKQKKATVKPVFAVDDLFYMSWGYNQTNVNFYQVIDKPSAHFALIQEIHGTYTKNCQVTAVPNSFKEKEPMRKKILMDNNGKPYINMKSYANAYPTEVGREHYETPAGCGH